MNSASLVSTGISAEAQSQWNFLLAASSFQPAEGQKLQLRRILPEIDWATLLHLAHEHGTSSLVYQNCLLLNDVVPADALAELRRRHERNVQKSLLFARELIRILNSLDSLGIPAIPYKGVALSEVYYGDMAMRHSGDIDLFVRRSDVERCKKAVVDLGYVPRLVLPELALNHYLASGYECTFNGPLGQNSLELKWALQPHFYAVDFDIHGLFRRAVNVSVAGRSLKAPSPEDLLLVLSVHAAKHVWGRLIWLCDIVRILQRDHLDWDWVQSRAREMGVARILHVTLLLTNRLLGQAIPGPLEAAVVADQNAQSLTDEIAGAVKAGVSYDQRQDSYFRLMMRLRERNADRVRFLTRLTFTPGPGEWNAIRLPRLLFPAYRAVRMVRLAARFAGNKG